MRTVTPLHFLLFFICATGATLSAQGGIDATLDRWHDEHLIFESADQFWYAELSGQIDGWVYGADGDKIASGWYFQEPGEAPDFYEDVSASARLTLRLDAYAGERVYAFVKFRLDNGVHPGVTHVYTGEPQARFDEYYLKVSVLEDGLLDAQVGRFTPHLGAFMTRQDSWDNALNNYPLLYNNVTSVSDPFPPASPEQFANRRNLPDLKTVWLPLIWAQLYTQGASLTGRAGDWNYALNLTNRAPSSRSVQWEQSFDHPTFSGRLGYRPGAAWDWGLSYSYGAYLQDEAVEDARWPAGARVGDYTQKLLGLDVAYATGPWQFWAEAWWGEFELPNVADDARIYSYFLEVKRELGPKWWLALRWNQEFYNQITTVNGKEDWDNQIQRIDWGLGWKPLRHVQLKFTHVHQYQERVNHLNARNTYLLNAVMRF